MTQSGGQRPALSSNLPGLSCRGNLFTRAVFLSQEHGFSEPASSMNCSELSWSDLNRIDRSPAQFSSFQSIQGPARRKLWPGSCNSLPKVNVIFLSSKIQNVCACLVLLLVFCGFRIRRPLRKGPSRNSLRLILDFLNPPLHCLNPFLH